MFGATFWLTLATLTGLAAGFAREWLLIAAWGAGPKSDAFLVALFLPEALRMALAGGVLSAAALPLYQERNDEARRQWLSSLTPQLLLAGCVLAALCSLFAPWLVLLLGPGLAADASGLAAQSLQLLAWCIPGFFLQALFAVPLQAAERFTLVGLGSLLFNLPIVIYLAANGAGSTHSGLAGACLLGSFCMAVALVPPLCRDGWRPWHWRRSFHETRELGRRLGPLLASNAASQGLALLERMIASLLGEGAVTWINLARKLINLPLVALMSLNQVLLGLMSGKQGEARLTLLRRGLDCATLLTLPTALGIIGAAPALAHFLLPQQASLSGPLSDPLSSPHSSPLSSPLPALLAWFAVPLVFGAWNALLARYAYADGDTRLPLRCELSGNACNALLLLVLPFLAGIPGIAFAALGGILLTGFLLMRRQNLLHHLPWSRQWGVSVLLLAVAGLLLFPLSHPWLQIGASTAAAALTFAGFALWLRPWKNSR